MPFRDNATHFRDILEAIRHIEDFLQGIDYETYKGDAKTKSAAERQMQILTEAAYRLDADGEKMARVSIGKVFGEWAICLGMPITASMI